MSVRRLALLALVLAGCGPSTKPTQQTTPPPPPPPTGDLLRFKTQPGEHLRYRVKLAFETDSGKKHIELRFTFTEEDKVESATEEGAVQVNARLVDAVGEAVAGANPQLADDFALALDELKIKMKRTPRGEVESVSLAGLRTPLQESTARSIVNALYGAQRGPLFPKDRVAKGGTWKTSAPLPAASGFEGEVSYDFTYGRKTGEVAVVDSEGRIDVDNGNRHLNGRSSSEYRFDIGAGCMLSSTVDQTTQLSDDGAGTTQRQRIRVEATLASEQPEKEEK